ncbi:MAG TPA: hypothetical protein VN635_15645 [Conexibacter sp.]|nr:hypothetical protein [Conexibacter sp.]
MTYYQPIDPPGYGANQALSVLEAYQQAVFDTLSLGDRGPVDPSATPLSDYEQIMKPGRTSLSRAGAVFTVASVWLADDIMDPDTILVTIGDPGKQGSVRRFRISTGYLSPRRKANWLHTWMLMYFLNPKLFEYICNGLRTMQTGQQPGQPAI